jgi:GTPase-activator protein for Ras-like GTPase
MRTTSHPDSAAAATYDNDTTLQSAKSMTASSSSRPQRWLGDTASPDYFNPSTIRTVTPDSIPEEREEELLVQATQGRTSSRLSMSTPASPHGTHDRSPQGSSRHYRIRAGSSNELGQTIPTRDQQYAALRPRTRTLETSTRVLGGSNSGRSSRETSPHGGLYMRSNPRSRMGSSNSVSGTAAFGGSATGGVEDVVTSIGHPSTIALPPLTSYEVSAPKRKLDGGKKFAKINNSRELPSAQPFIDVAGARRPSLASAVTKHYQYRPDMNKVLSLIKSSCGKMEGQLAFRRFETTPWALSHCNINDDSGSLVYEPKSGGPYKTLIPDIRGCNIKIDWDPESQAPFLDVCPQNSKLRVHLRPHTLEEFDSWYAALLCWQPMRPKGAQNRMTKPQIPVISDRKPPDTRRHSEVSLHKEPPIIKIGKMIYWDTDMPKTIDTMTPTPGPNKLTKHRQALGIRRWQQVSSTLRENGELKLHTDDNNMTLIRTVHLAQLSRCAVQRLDPSVLEMEFCIAIYPQYSVNTHSQSIGKPIFLSFEGRVLYEVWIVLLRAFTIPQLYGPKQALTMEASQSEGRPTSYVSSTADMFRMERHLSFRVMQARLVQPMSPRLEQPPASRSESNGSKENGGYYAEILLDGEIRARTTVKANETTPQWRDEFEFDDLPAAVSVASVVLKKRAPNHPVSQKNIREETKKLQNALKGAGSSTGSTEIPLDQVHGQVDIFLDDLESGEEVDKWWPLVNQFGQQVGEVLVHVMAEESVILMAKDYIQMSELLHRFSNGLTLQISQKIPGEMKRLTECLLNIFQVSSMAADWIKSLVEEEIDGTLKDQPLTRLRFNKRRMSSNENGEIRSHSPQFDRELFLRDMNKSATLEANLLFRGNTLLTKTLDLHMKRLGKDYLEEILGERLRDIAERDPDCEVDPNKLGNNVDIERNWRRLIKLTSDCFNLIAGSAEKCPPELRYIFRHIKACAEDRYGDYIRSVKYSSVSGFLFLRFFVPAILNPQLPAFGLIKGNNTVS